jgi:diguanylate cyclase (GGDEF)-like protein/PAS domain S-box-containing protein
MAGHAAHFRPSVKSLPAAPAPDPGPDPALAGPFRLILLTVGVTLATFAAIYLATGAWRTGTAAFTLFTATVLSWGILERGRLALAAGVLLYSAALGSVAFLWNGYGVRDYAVVGYPILFFAGCVFLGTTAYWGLVALVLASVSIFGIAELSGAVRNSLSGHVSVLGIASLLIVLAAAAVAGRVLMLVVRASTDRARALSGALLDSEAIVQRVFRSTQNALSVSRLEDGRYLEVNDAYLTTFGFRREDVIGKTSTEVGLWEDPRDRERFAQQLREQRAVKDLEMRFRRRGGEAMECLLSAEVMQVGRETCILSSVADVTAHRAAERRARFLSTRDPLTGLPNRVLALDRLQHAIDRSRRGGLRIALVHLGLDHFKAVNESLGHGSGDEVLRECCARVQAALGVEDTLARVAGDQFLVIAPSLRDAAEADASARKVLAAFDAPFTVGGQPVRVACTAGMALYPEDSRDPEELLRQAESAMHFGKTGTRGRFLRFEPAMAERIRDQLLVETSLREAIATGGLRLHYQPKFDLRSGAVTGLEALCRWTHPRLGVVAPSRFIAIAEQSELIHELGRWVLDECCAQIARWKHEGRRPVPVAVNLSARQLDDDLPAALAAAARRAGIDPASLEVEVTESMLIGNPQDTRRLLEQVALGGTRVVLDDFGVGYSSLNYIRHLPLEGVKIDRTFLREYPANRHDAAIVDAILSLSHGLGMRVVAEGIETAAQQEALASIGCDEGQGFHLCEPLDGDAVAARYLAA